MGRKEDNVRNERSGELLSELGISLDSLGNFDDFCRNADSDIGNSVSLWENGSGDGALVFEDDLSGAQDLDLELNAAETSIIQFAQRSVGKRGRGSQSEAEKKIYVTHEDFEEGPERDAFLLIYGYAEHLFSTKNSELQEAAIKFFFCFGEDAIGFEDAAACIDTFIRVDVIRLRIMYEFWLLEWHLKLPFTAMPLPSRVSAIAAQHADLIGIDIVREAWFEPGIEAEMLIQRVVARNPGVTQKTIEGALEKLLLFHVISESTESDTPRFYTTGKNPILKQKESIIDRGRVRRSLDSIHWSRLF